jgi:tRNA(adenine34) deaminase
LLFEGIVLSLHHEHFMNLALEQAHVAAQHGDVPVGAVLVREGNIVAFGHNRREIDGDPTAHAEIVALRSAAKDQGHWRLDGTTLYVTMEPCAMCAGALVNARIQTLVFGTLDAKAGACGSLMNICQDSRLNHRLVIASGILQKESSNILKEFFRLRREQKRLVRELKRNDGSQIDGN